MLFTLETVCQRTWWLLRATVPWLRGSLDRLRGRNEEAERRLRRAVDICPGSFRFQLAYARALLALGREDEAFAAFRTCYWLNERRFERLRLPPRCRERVVIGIELPR